MGEATPMGSSLSPSDVLAGSQAALAAIWPGDVTVEAMVTDVSASSSRHLFCRLGPERLPVVIPPRVAAGLVRRVGSRRGLVGVRVEVRGQVELSASHELQLVATSVRVLAHTYAATDPARMVEARLAGEGVFDLQRRLTLPPAPLRVVLIGPAGNGTDDVLSVLAGSLWDIAVQVISAPSTDGDALVAALRSVDTSSDLVLLVRGGGDLAGAAYDDEPVVRAVATCPVPVATGIGHTADRTLCDRAAALSLATPTAAARWVVDRLAELDAGLVTASERVRAAAERRGLALDGTPTRVELGTDLVPDLRRIVELVGEVENPATASRQAAVAADGLLGRVTAIRSRLTGGKQ